MPECKRCYNFSADGDYYAQGTLQRLSASASNGCPTCDVLVRSIRQLLPEEPAPETKYVVWTMNTRDRTDMLHPADSAQKEMSLRVEKEPFVPDHDISIYALPEDPSSWDAVPLSRHLPTSTDSEESYAFATRSLNQCLESHRLCDNPTDEFLPLRLVDVGEPDASQVRVVETIDMDPAEHRYLALSHCWGPSESITTQLNDETYEEYKRGIPISALPKTFFDAVAFVRNLGHRYLWIDSLCIIQGNVDDWLTEGAKMSKIYENSLLTLAAASSSSGHGGLFYRPPRVELAGSTADNKYRVFSRFSINHRFFNFPLMNRAWVLQERLLSPRTLYFTHQELVWECRSCNVCQCSPILGGFRAQVAGFPENSKLQPATAHLDENALVSKWHEVVEVYSQLKLTKPADKLMAIDGIAQYMSPIRKSQHLAGIWSDSIALDLAWTVDTFDESRSRVEKWRAPTWSWASMEAKIKWHMEEGSKAKTQFTVEKWPQQVHEIQPWTKSGEDSYLSLRGVLVKTTLAEADVVVNSSPCLYEDHAEWVPITGHTKDEEPLYCLRLVESESLLCSLALRKTGPEDENLYERHGLLMFSANPKNENDIWNTRDKGDWGRWRPRNLQAGYPVWWVGDSVSTVTIL